MKIGQYLANIYGQEYSVRFFSGHPVHVGPLFFDNPVIQFSNDVFIICNEEEYYEIQN